jgi:hypothetical protein
MIAAARANPWRAFGNWERDHTLPCSSCGGDVLRGWMPDVGPPDTLYCSNACRQRAYRKRKALLGVSDKSAPTGAVGSLSGPLQPHTAPLALSLPGSGAASLPNPWRAP